MKFKISHLHSRSFLAAGIILAGIVPLRAGFNPELFNRDKMTKLDLTGLQVWLGVPVQVTAQLGWQENWTGHDPRDPQACFIHLTPYLAQFPRGNLIATYAMDTDSNDNPVSLSAYQISDDGGAHWGRRCTVLMQHESMVFVPKPHNSLLAVASEFVQPPSGSKRDLVGPTYLFEEGGKHMTFTVDGARVLDWPWDLAAPVSGPQPRESWEAQFNLTGNVIKVGSRWLATAYASREGDPPNTYVSTVVTSEDGYTWRYLSTIARSGGARGTDLFFDDANETSIVQLADGDLMAVFRTDQSKNRHLRRCYSHDGGRSWTAADVLPAYSVSPQLLRLHNDTMALVTGRPGIDLWIATDPRASSWQKVDLKEHQNQWAPDPSYRISPVHLSWAKKADQTCSYTGVVEVAPNRLLIVYDRDTEKAPANEHDLSRVFVVPVEIERK